MKKNVEMPRYMKIAVDVASRIHEGELIEGSKLHGRSTLASEYHVSPETIRRSMRLLEDMNVVTVTQGSGIYIKSKDNAFTFLERFKNKESISTLKSDLKQLVKNKNMIEIEIQNTLNTIIDYSDRLKHINIITPVEIVIPDDSSIIGNTIQGTKFWQNTGATIVAIKRNEKVILSPGPYSEFKKGDIIVIVGDNYVYTRVQRFLETNSND